MHRVHDHYRFIDTKGKRIEFKDIPLTVGDNLIDPIEDQDVKIISIKGGHATIQPLRGNYGKRTVKLTECNSWARLGSGA